MEEKRREDIGLIIANFRGKAVTQNSLDEFCNKIKTEPLVMGDYEDYLYQVEHDEKVSKLYPLILATIQKLKYIPEFSSQKERKELAKANDDVRIEVAKLFEESAISYRTVDTLGQELGRIIGGTIMSAGTTVFNKALDVLLLLAQKEFGEEFNVKHAADYATKHYAKKVDEKTV